MSAWHGWIVAPFALFLAGCGSASVTSSRAPTHAAPAAAATTASTEPAAAEGNAADSPDVTADELNQLQERAASLDCLKRGRALVDRIAPQLEDLANQVEATGADAEKFSQLGMRYKAVVASTEVESTGIKACVDEDLFPLLSAYARARMEPAQKRIAMALMRMARDPKQPWADDSNDDGVQEDDSAKDAAEDTAPKRAARPKARSQRRK